MPITKGRRSALSIIIRKGFRPTLPRSPVNQIENVRRLARRQIAKAEDLSLDSEMRDAAVEQFIEERRQQALGSWFGIAKSHRIRGWQGAHPVSQIGVPRDRNL